MDTSLLYLSEHQWTLPEVSFINVISVNCLELRGAGYFPHSGPREIEDHKQRALGRKQKADLSHLFAA